MPHFNVSEVKMTVEKEKRNRTQVLIKFQGNCLNRTYESIFCVHKLILFQIRNICLHSGKGQTLCLFIGKVILQTVFIIEV